MEDAGHPHLIAELRGDLTGKVLGMAEGTGNFVSQAGHPHHMIAGICIPKLGQIGQSLHGGAIARLHLLGGAILGRDVGETVGIAAARQRGSGLFLYAAIRPPAHQPDLLALADSRQPFGHDGVKRTGSELAPIGQKPDQIDKIGAGPAQALRDPEHLPVTVIDEDDMEIGIENQNGKINAVERLGHGGGKRKTARIQTDRWIGLFERRHNSTPPRPRDRGSESDDEFNIWHSDVLQRDEGSPSSHWASHDAVAIPSPRSASTN